MELKIEFDNPLAKLIGEWKHRIVGGTNPCAEIDMSQYKKDIVLYQAPKNKRWNKRKIKKMIRTGRIKPKILKDAYPVHMGVDPGAGDDVTMEVTFNFDRT